MKKLFTLALALVALSSCSKEQVDPNAPVEVKMSAKIVNTKAAITQGDAVTGVQFARVDGDTPDWTSVDAITLTGDIAGNGAITLSSAQYYPSTGNVNFIGYFPAATSFAAGVASMEIDGTNDLIYAKPVAGTKATTEHKMAFEHMLTQFKFIVKKDANVNPDVANVSVKIKAANTVFTMAIADGALSAWGTPIEITAITGGTAATTASTPTEPLMLEPNLTSITLLVSADGYAEKEITINGTDGGKFKQGFAYDITLTFKATSVVPTSTISAWENGTAGGGDIN